MKSLLAILLLMLGSFICTIIKQNVHLHSWDPEIILALIFGGAAGMLILSVYQDER